MYVEFQALEAVKKSSFNSAVSQVLAKMLAAQRFNAARDKPKKQIFGVVTSGTDWRFLQLAGTQAVLDLHEYPLAELECILGILVWMAEQ